MTPTHFHIPTSLNNNYINPDKHGKKNKNNSSDYADEGNNAESCSVTTQSHIHFQM